MIKTLIDIGKALRNLYPMPFVEVPYCHPSKKGKNEPKVFVVELNTSSADLLLHVTDIKLQDYSPADNMKRYFFRNPASSHGPATSLSFKLPGKPSALRQRLGILTELGYKADINEIAEAIEGKHEELKSNGSLAKNAPILVVLRIDKTWPAENKKLRDVFLKNIFDGLSSYKKKPIWKQRGICHGCGEETTVYGGVGNLMKFYTVDKYGYAPELNPKVSWKQYALCKDCIFDLERGRRAVDDFLTWQFYGENFWLLPVSASNLRKTLEEFRDLHKELAGKAQKEGFESLEDYLLHEASLQKDIISYHFVFVQPENQALRIKLHLEEVLPSVLSQYVATKRETEDTFNQFVFEAIAQKNDFHFNFFSSKNLKETKQRPGFTKEDFFILVGKVFRRSYIDERYLIHKIMSRITQEMAEAKEDRNQFPRFLVLEALLSLEFLLRWGSLKRKTGGIEMSNSQFEGFFEQHKDFFNHPAKRGLVLLGVLVQKFLNYQFKERNSTPFLRVLKNLKLTQKDVQSVLVSLQNKMNEYGIGHYWPELREAVSLNFIEAGDKWPLSPDEIGFYIAVGMSLHSHPVFKEAGYEQSGTEK